MKILRNTAIVFIVLLGIAFAFFKVQVEKKGSFDIPLTIEIVKGASSQRAADILYQSGAISNPLIFRVLLKYKGVDGQIKAGEYLFDPKLSMVQILEKLIKGDILYHRVTIPEGYTVGQILYLLSTTDNLSGEFEKVPEEGGLLPETYTFSKGKERSILIEEARSAMSRKLQEIWETRDEGLPYRNMKEMLIMASIIEKETGVNDERAKVASVFINRLRKGMLLQTDPTVIYALTEGKEELKRLLTRKDLQIDSPYNTYKYAGLPPTPICNPGVASLIAAAHPDETDYLYFVANGSGGHNFAKTLSEHNQNVANWKKIR